MTLTTPTNLDLDPRVAAAVDLIAAAMGLRPVERSRLVAFLDELQMDFPKLPHVSFYVARTPAGVNCRITYKIRGYRRRTERLGRVPRVAYRRAVRVSEILQNVAARMTSPEEAHRLLYVDNQPVERHVLAFEASIKSKGSVARYITTTMTRLRRCLELMEVDRIGDIRRDGLPRLIEKLRQFQDPDTGRRVSDSTLNDYLATLRQFTKWATPQLLTVDPLVNTSGIKGVTENKRRDVLPEELAAIVRAARASSRRFAMSGADRALLYLVAYATGLRANELRSLEVPWLKLSVQPPYIAVPAHVTKTKKEAHQPLPSWLIPELVAHLGDRKSGPVWLVFADQVQQLFDADRLDARAAWIDAAGSADEQKQRREADFLQRKTSDGEITFHSLRHAFSTAVLANMDLKSAQQLTRHRTASMLTERYAHARKAVAAAGVEASIQDPMALAQSAAHRKDS